MTETSNPILAEVISIGDEMTSGARLDTNAQWLSRRLGELGAHVAFHSTVGDTLSHNVDVFRTAASRVDVLVCTGGLGPTRDDLTRQALSEASGQPLEFDASAMDHIESLFARRHREMPERNRIQAMFPRGSRQIFNPQGTAPGIEMDLPAGTSACRVFALPGVPAEMKRMFDESVAPSILDLRGDSQTHIAHDVMKFFGVGESDMEQRLVDMIARDRVPRVGITVSSATISLRITAVGFDETECRQQINLTRREILDRVGELHFGDGESFELQHAVHAWLLSASQSLATVELGRSAVLADWFAGLGQSAAYRGGFCFANLDELAAVLQIDSSMALETLRDRTGADWLLLVDEYPALDSSADQPLPACDVTFTLMGPDGKPLTGSSRMGGHPSILHARIGKAALAWMRGQLPPPSEVDGAEQSDRPNPDANRSTSSTTAT
ncbi:MAG: molybdopterin-binding protein [Planctomycetota bacterium]